MKRWTIGMILVFVSGCSDYSNTRCPDGPTGVTFRLVNDSGATRYFGQRASGFPFDFFADLGTEWEIFLPGLDCYTNCDGCLSDCRDSCVPVFPEWCAPVVETMEAGYAEEFTWDGKRTESQYEEFPTCYCAEAGESVSCLHEWESERGRYKVKLCHAATFTPLDDGCGGDHLRGDLDDPTCLDVEFDYELCDLAPVEVRIQ